MLVASIFAVACRCGGFPRSVLGSPGLSGSAMFSSVRMDGSPPGMGNSIPIANYIFLKEGIPCLYFILGI